MDSLEIQYIAIAANIDEKAIRDMNFSVRAEKIARAKAEKILSDYPEAIIIAGDSFPVNNGIAFEKPATIKEAKEMLKQESGGKATLFSGFCYIDKRNKIDFSTTITVDFTLRVFDEKEIEDYVKKFPVLTWSGALFAGHPYGASMIKEIHGPFSAFVYGFPTDLVIEYLQKSGITI